MGRAVTEQAQRSGQDDKRDPGGEQGDGDAGIREGAKEVHGEGEQRAEGDGDRHRGIGNGPPGGVQCRAQGRLDVVPGLQLLAEAVDDEQRIVDAQAQPQGRGEVEREDAHVGDRGEHAQHGQGADHGIDADEHRQQPGHDRAEDGDEQQQGHRDGQGFGDREVLLHLRGQVGDRLRDPAGLDRHALRRGRREGGLERGDALAVVVLVALDVRDDERGSAAGPPQASCCGWRSAPIVGHEVDPRFGVQPGSG